ncbi:3-oxoacyl-[acyl-carrier-protein] synthase II, chloroplastic-like [Gastrolobium bilobum]|uniref:3-oxoacyl-[acyl-carrier-protein] synthase II, chloroplastic-like n=1 Tax=Gastrolobium bilobum TaxID=150636 RepID=UPI002AB2AFE3|nr:3-oxoacyl-[acyl-carrier-protein] synthase II, chloroplastic-like [Gastrolobium bilobum]
MGPSFVASPLCTWLVAACMSVTYDKHRSKRFPMHQHQSPKRLSQWATRPKKFLSKCINGGRPSDCTSIMLSPFCGYGIQNLISCLALEPYKECYNSMGLSSYLSSFVNNASSLFGSKAASSGRIYSTSLASNSGKTMAVTMNPSEKVTRKKKPLIERRVVVTGLGVVTPVGHDPDFFYNNLLSGISGISEIEGFDCTQFPTRIAGEIKSFSADGWVSSKLIKRADKFMLYMLTAGKKALTDGGITEEVAAKLDKSRCGVIIGSALGGMQVFSDAIEALRVSYKKMNPFCVPFATTNIGSALLAMDLGWMGPNYSISTACATSNFCILSAANHITRGETDMMLCGGSDAAVIPVGLGGFVAVKALSQRNNEPTKASRPWDCNRDGFVLGEGAGVLLLEELEHAKERGATIYAEFLGGSFTCDAYHMTEPHPDGIVLCIEKALAQSEVARRDVNYINAHAASTLTGDLKEYEAVIRCFGKNPELRINSTKSMIGHLLGASGAVEAVATVMAVKTGWIHPNINLENPDKNVDSSFIVGSQKERLDIKVALSNSFGFGGHNSSILFAPYIADESESGV